MILCARTYILFTKNEDNWCGLSLLFKYVCMLATKLCTKKYMYTLCTLWIQYFNIIYYTLHGFLFIEQTQQSFQTKNTWLHQCACGHAIMLRFCFSTPWLSFFFRRILNSINKTKSMVWMMSIPCILPCHCHFAYSSNYLSLAKTLLDISNYDSIFLPLDAKHIFCHQNTFFEVTILGFLSSN